jgi:hypothetical protein
MARETTMQRRTPTVVLNVEVTGARRALFDQWIFSHCGQSREVLRCEFHISFLLRVGESCIGHDYDSG